MHLNISIFFKFMLMDGAPLFPQGFNDHVKINHNMWNYIYFSIYLDQIDTSDHNAIEGYVYEMVRTLIISL